MNRRQTHAAFLSLMTHFEVRLRKQIIIDKNRFVRTCATRYEDQGTPNFFDLTDRHQKDIRTTLSSAYSKIIPAFGRHAIEQVPAARKKAGSVSLQTKSQEDEDVWLDLADEWIQREGLRRAHMIADTTEEDVLAAISNGMEAGLGTAEIARNIRRVTKLSGWRADLIARTETHAAANYGSIETVRNAEQTLDVKMLKEWAPTLDARTRESHAAMAGSQPIPLDRAFLVGGESMDRPGDPGASAAMNINCRCTMLYHEAD